MKRFSLLIIYPILLVACNNTSDESKSYVNSRETAKEKAYKDHNGGGASYNAISGNAQAPKEIKTNQLKLLKSARLELKTQSIEHAKDFLDRLLDNKKGYYSNESFDKSPYEASYNLTIRVPADQFSFFLKNVNSGPFKLVSKDVKSRDVSEEYADTEARIISKRAYLKRYQELLGKAKDVTELLVMEEQIRALIEEIEAAESKLKHYDNFIAYSEIHIRLYQTYKVPEHVEVEEPGFWSQLGDSFASGWHGIERFIIGFFKAWPSLLVFGALLFFFRRPIRQFLLLIQGKKTD